jgi:hypothetical protein
MSSIHCVISKIHSAHILQNIYTPDTICALVCFRKCSLVLAQFFSLHSLSVLLFNVSTLSPILNLPLTLTFPFHHTLHPNIQAFRAFSFSKGTSPSGLFLVSMVL